MFKIQMNLWWISTITAIFMKRKKFDVQDHHLCAVYHTLKGHQTYQLKLTCALEHFLMPRMAQLC